MTDYTGRGAVPIDDAVVDDPPTVDELLEENHKRADELTEGADERSDETVDAHKRRYGRNESPT
ncbi:MAG: hypothetical protein ACRDZZ_00105 [Ilumatobacteraceae bacterium]